MRRLVSVGHGERNYHIFYQFVNGIESINSTVMNTHKITTVTDYKLLILGNCLSVTGVDDAGEFAALCRALQALGCSSDTLLGLWNLLAVILHLGNASFRGGDVTSPAEMVITTTSLEHIAGMLGVHHSLLITALTNIRIQSGQGLLCII